MLSEVEALRMFRRAVPVLTAVASADVGLLLSLAALVLDKNTTSKRLVKTNNSKPILKHFSIKIKTELSFFKS